VRPYSLDPTEAVCPACTQADGRVLYAVSSEEAAQHYVLREADPERSAALVRVIERLWGGPTCRVVRCSACAFCFADPYVAGDAEFYTLAYERTGYPAWKWEFEQTRTVLRRLRPTLGSAPALLEVGAGNGAFIRGIVPDLFERADVLGTEFSEYGAREIERLGVACERVDVRSLDLDVWGGRFTVVCLFQVLEHLDRLDRLFEHLTALTTTNGHVFIAVPNDARIEFNEHHGGLLDMPPNHVGRWTRRSFEALVGRHGWRVVEHALEPVTVVADLVGLATFRYMRRRQSPGSVANWIERRPRRIRRPLQAIAAGVYGFASLRALAELARSPGLGSSQWVHLEKAAPGP
jgi:SAM-dependent methyltransferase